MLNMKLIQVTNMFISMLSTYLYNMGARRRLWTVLATIFDGVRAIRQNHEY